MSSSQVLGLDVETRLFGPGDVAPEVICCSFADSKTSFVLGNGDEQLVPMIRHVLENEHFGGSRIQFDLACICRTWPALTPLVFQALKDGRVSDTIIREKLLNLGTVGELEIVHGKKVSYSLASLAYARLGVDISADKQGEDIWRLRFGELDGRKAADYPPEAYHYARKDAQLTREILRDQAQHPQAEALFKTEAHHVRAAFCLMLLGARGMKVDPVEKAELEAIIDRELKVDPENKELWPVYEPLWKDGPSLVTPAQPPRPYANGCGKMTAAQPEKVNKSEALQPLIEKVCLENGLEVKRTDPEELSDKFKAKFPNGQISCSSEDVEEIADLHPALQAYVYRQERIRYKTEFLPALEWPRGSGVVADVVHYNTDPLKKTGRSGTSGNRKGKDAAYPAIHIQAVPPRVRELFVPREGYVYAVADFNAIDLCSLAQTIYQLFGHSTLRDQINSGIEPHAYMGSVLALDQDERFRGETRDIQLDSRKLYEFFLSTKKAGWKCGCPSSAKDEGLWFNHYRAYAKVFGLTCPGGGGLRTLCKIASGYGFRITKEQARHNRNLWSGVYPEMRRYLSQWVEDQIVPGTDKRTYVSPLGMVRAGCSYTECANGRALQTPAAEGFKEATWRVTRACYDPTLGDVLLGSYPVVGLHDELVVEVPDDGLAGARAERMSALMVEGMRMVLPDVRITADPLLTRRWTKRAKPVRKNGKLEVWNG